ncbi:M16 family metallopeptidase [Vibrio vulnificus]
MSSCYLVASNDFREVRGIRLNLCHLPDVDTVSLQFWYPAGSAFDEPNLPGLAHLAEHIIYTSGDIISPTIGRFDTAFTNHDSTAHIFRVRKTHVTEALIEFLKHINRLTVSETALEREKRVIDCEIHTYLDSRLNLDLDTNLKKYYINHPYANPSIGTRDGVFGVDKSTLNTFIHSMYRQRCPIVTVAGDLSQVNAFEIIYQLENFYSKEHSHFNELPASEALFDQNYDNGKLSVVMRSPLIEHRFSRACSSLVWLLNNKYIVERILSLKGARLYVNRFIKRADSCLYIELVSENLEMEELIIMLSELVRNVSVWINENSSLYKQIESARVLSYQRKLVDHSSYGQYVAWISSLSNETNAVFLQSLEPCTYEDLSQYVSTLNIESTFHRHGN